MSRRIRVGGIIIHQESILLMYRYKNDREYWTFCGGGVEENELPEVAILREIKEESCIDVQLESLFCKSDTFNMDQYFYFCKYLSGNPKLSDDSIEQAKYSSNNIFIPQWVPLSLLPKLNLYPEHVKISLMDYLNISK